MILATCRCRAAPVFTYLLTYVGRRLVSPARRGRDARAAWTRRPRGRGGRFSRAEGCGGPVRGAAEPSTIDVRAAGGAVRVVTSEPPCLTGRVVATPRSRASPGSRSAISASGTGLIIGRA